MRTCLLAQVPRVATVDVFAPRVIGEDALGATLLNPAGYGDFPVGRKLPARGGSLQPGPRAGAIWRGQRPRKERPARRFRNPNRKTPANR